MPAFSQDVTSVDYPWTLAKVGVTGNGFAGYAEINNGYSATPCLLFRTTTNRNSPKLTEGKLRRSFSVPLFEWYSRKPKATPESLKDKRFRKEFLKKKADWRRSRPIRVRPSSPPPGWKVVELPTGKMVLKFNGVDPLVKISRFTWVPELRRSLRPVNRSWTRHNSRIPLNARVNDLQFFHQTAWAAGFGEAYVKKTTNPITNPDYLSNPDILGYVLWQGNFSYLPWEDLGYDSSTSLGVDDKQEMGYAATLSFWSSEIEGLSKLALKRHYLKLKNQKVDLFTELSQGLLTVNLIVDIAKRIAKTLLFLKKLDVTSAFKVLFPTSPKGVANDYLAWKYGIKPLIGDLQGAAEHLAEYISRLAPFKSNGHAKSFFTKTSSEILADGTEVTVIRTAHIRVKYGTSYRVPFEITRQAASLGFTNPENTLWELLPFSFVVDWFLPIGDFLQSLSALDGLEPIETYKTIVISEDIVRLQELDRNRQVILSPQPVIDMTGLTNRGAAGYIDWTNLNSVLVRNNFYCERQVIPLANVPFPNFKNPLSGNHILSAIALFTQLLKKD